MTNLAPILPKIDATAYFRTAVPVWWGSLLAFLAAQIPAVADFFAFIDEQVGSGWRQLAGFIAAAAVIYAYYWVARQIGRRWPAAEKWLIGSSSQPVYVAPEVAATVTPESEVAVINEGEVVLSEDAVDTIGAGYIKQVEQIVENDGNPTTPPWGNAV
ncbi:MULTISPECIES: hypothetical protein [unclassified Microbacterium]|uniref:hypothetical protein n=1 Tax=unclassified Microbacterium TaxID=2609290 RepID=UPI000EA85726|nr:MULTISPECIES: hypothetical protein [unclassified Microbacterium]MBT2484844.1 hypothetical protein [Microbacterium sp. ISL-108]RKN67714.1 hypothetical protein D7252_09005 [Microbacterium sp. CGR2]